MRIDIPDHDARVLHEVLTDWLADASTEIRHTDNPGVRARLRERREGIRRVVDALSDTDGEEPVAS
jgi:hypothetical protein